MPDVFWFAYGYDREIMKAERVFKTSHDIENRKILN